MSSWTYRLVRYRDGRGYAAGDDGAHEEAGVDRPAQAHHGDLAGRQGLVQPSLVLDNHGCRRECGWNLFGAISGTMKLSDQAATSTS